jgi:hypothetical protein
MTKSSKKPGSADSDTDGTDRHGALTSVQAESARLEMAQKIARARLQNDHYALGTNLRLSQV